MTPQRFTAIVAMLSAFPVSADELVGRADANGDGDVSLYELRAAYYADMEFNRRIEQTFADYDTDGDGLISEAERRAAAVATAETAPATVTAPVTAAGTASTPAAATAPVTAAGMASTPATTTAPVTAAEMAPTPAAATAPAAAAERAPTPATGAAPVTAAGMASTPAADTVSVGTPRMGAGAGRSGDRSPEVAPAATAADGALPDTRSLSRTELLIQENDADNSGGASVEELVASGDGRQWFPDSAFARADKNSDGDLDPDELEVLLQSMERRRR